jgi:hypothetical protein
VFAGLRASSRKPGVQPRSQFAEAANAVRRAGGDLAMGVSSKYDGAK